MIKRRKHAILGAGLAGLSAGFHLKEPFELFESEKEIGGVARSTKIGDFTFDHAIHVLYTKDPYASDLIRNLLGDNFCEHERSAWIYSNKSLIRYPYQTNMFGLSARVIRENLHGLHHANAVQQHSPRNFEEWISATFGTGIARNFMFPFNRKLWAADLNTVGFQWIADRVPQPNIAEIVRGAFLPQDDRFGPNATFWYPRYGGTSALPKSFLPHLPPVRTGMAAIGIDSEKRTIHFQNWESFQFENLITTVPLPRLLVLLNAVPPRISELARTLRSNRVWTVNLGIAREHISGAHWIYVPEPPFAFHRISFPINFSASLAPKGTSSIMAEISESDTKPVDERGILDRTVAGLRTMGILRRDDTILCSGVTRIDPAYVLYGTDHEACVAEIQAYLRSIGIISCGRFGEWKYLNMDQAILSGKRAAEIATSNRIIPSEKFTHANTIS
ncbi:MAG TPA: FAD-dependent oxidoreductase [Candidatus Kapabacteria bacterium]